MKVPAEQLRSLLGITDVNVCGAAAFAGDCGFDSGVVAAGAGSAAVGTQDLDE